jgi:hypothetical protein
LILENHIDDLFFTILGPLGFGLAASIYATWSIWSWMRSSESTKKETIWALVGLCLFYVSATMSLVLLVAILPHSSPPPLKFIAMGESLSIASVFCAFQIEHLAPRSWLRGAAVCVALSWIPYIAFHQMFFRR